MLEKKYYDGMQIHDVLCECLDDYDTILTILEKFASLPSAINADRKTEPQTERLEQFRVGLEYHTDTAHFGKVKGESITTNKVKDEPQTDCSWK